MLAACVDKGGFLPLAEDKDHSMGSSSLSSVPSTIAVSAVFAGAAMTEEAASAAARLRRAAIEARDHASSSGSLSEEAISMGNALEPPSVEERVVKSTVLDGAPD